MGKNLLPAQIGKMAGRLLDNDQLLPSVLGTANSDHIMTVVRFLPLERLAKQVSSVASSLAATVGVKVMNVVRLYTAHGVFLSSGTTSRGVPFRWGETHRLICVD